MMRLIIYFFVLVFVLQHAQTFAQNSQYAISSQLFATRFQVVNSIGFELEHKQWGIGVFMGYLPDRVVRFGHFSRNFKLSTHRTLVQQDKLTMTIAMDALSAFRVYPNNPDLSILSFFCGYGLVYGKRLQFTQNLAIGTSQFNPRALNLKPYWVHDFQLSFGLRYIFR
jgi:hypothetical protein